jgi:hypothetical protein
MYIVGNNMHNMNFYIRLMVGQIKLYLYKKQCAFFGTFYYYVILANGGFKYFSDQLFRPFSISSQYFQFKLPVIFAGSLVVHPAGQGRETLRNLPWITKWSVKLIEEVFESACFVSKG